MDKFTAPPEAAANLRATVPLGGLFDGESIFPSSSPGRVSFAIRAPHFPSGQLENGLPGSRYFARPGNDGLFEYEENQLYGPSTL
jgi:hypothetical protein